MLWTGFILGLTSSLHCVGMCGPIALALPGRGGSLGKILPGRLAYNLGRVATYATLGTAVGLFGEGLSFAGFQQGLSIALGVLLLLLSLFTFRVESRFLALPAVTRFMGGLKRRLGKLMRIDSTSSLFHIGILNGLLPCGFVYLGLAGAASLGSGASGLLYMSLFGLGTLPGMLSMSLIGKLTPGLQRYSRPIMLAVSLLFASWLIVRGLDLGIPYLSPELSPGIGEVTECG
ncbi:MAG: sulfite exporter TauE/SafE family protein [Bacteroidetes bacterium]|nr:MAG: sulfite exporter TauE/SafE family protein [Bacteroidota bacterium]